jgi:wyosine [tRNA(Phe)-imidazoG37] synthetase (radical SAM superfamily)
MQVRRREHYPAWAVVAAVGNRVAQLRDLGETVDALSFVPSGEPTLDLHLGREIRELAALGIPVAVFTNASLLVRPDVRAELAAADWVSVKVDAVRAGTWRRVNRPHRSLDLPEIIGGLRRFAAGFGGTLATETMLVRDLDDGDEDLRAAADLIAELDPDVAYLAVPTRPPACAWVRAPAAETLARAHEIFRRRLRHVALLTGPGGDQVSTTGDAVVDLLAITMVHPLREAAVAELLARDGAEWPVVGALVESGDLERVAHGGEVFYRRGRHRSRAARRRREQA